MRSSELGRHRLVRVVTSCSLVTLLIAGMAMVSAPAGAAGTFTDDDGSVHEANIEQLARVGVTRGCNPPVNDRYCPDEAVTRGQMAAFLHRALEGILTPGQPVEFTDDDTSVFEHDIEWLAATGVTRGCNPPANDRYCPDEAVTRGQMGAFLHRALADILSPTETVDFTDDNDSVFETDIEWLAATGVTRGCNPPANDRYCPDEPVTRAQMASFLIRALGDEAPSTSTSTSLSSTTTGAPSSTSPPPSTSTSTTIPAPDPSNAVWVTIDDTNAASARHESALVLSGSQLFLVGGRRTQPVQRFNLSTEAGWTNTGSSYTQIHHFQPAAVKDVIYLMGMMEGGCCSAETEVPVDHIQMFDPVDGEIEAGQPIPEGHRRGSAGAVAYDDHIYIGGGVTGGHGDVETDNLTTLDRYDPATNDWVEVSDDLRARDHFQAALVGDKIYFIGGRRTEESNFLAEENQVDEVDVFDIGTGQWSFAVTQLEPARSGAMVAVVGSDIYIIGGEGGDGHDQTGDPAHGRVDIFHTTTGNWSRGPDLIPPRHGTGAVVCGSDIYIVAGSTAPRGSNLDEVSIFQALDIENDELACLGQ